MQPPAIVAGGKNGNIRKPGGRLTRVMTNRFADRAIVGGDTKKELRSE